MLVLGLFYKRIMITEYHTNEDIAEAISGESVTLITELPEAGLEVTWLKDI